MRTERTERHLSFSVCLDGDLVRADLTGELDRSTAPALRRLLDAAVAMGARSFEVDCAGLTFVDGGGVGVLCRLASLSGDRGGRVTLMGLPPAVERLVDLLDLRPHFDLRPLDVPVPREELIVDRGSVPSSALDAPADPVDAPAAPRVPLRDPLAPA